MSTGPDLPQRRSFPASWQFLRQVGFEQVLNVQGGTEAWRAAGKPLVFGEHSADKPPVIDSAWAHAGVL